VIATSYFPAAVALPVVLGMLFQQTLASTFGKFLEIVEKRPTHPESIKYGSKAG
ncbi:bile acid:sodium symporter family protein, partial [Peribacillus sp. SIMBA_075]